jgi:predicted TIM-barrel fold metal-dependent hydrolase
MKYYPGLTLDAVFRQALAVAGAQRILFGTDSSFFPRGWQKGIHAVQTAALRAAGASEMDRQLILGGNFERLFPNHARR